MCPNLYPPHIFLFCQKHLLQFYGTLFSLLPSTYVCVSLFPPKTHLMNVFKKKTLSSEYIQKEKMNIIIVTQPFVMDWLNKFAKEKWQRVPINCGRQKSA